MGAQAFRDKSFWMTTRDYEPTTPLTEDAEVDVAIVGGGFTGLSTAYHLKKAEPNMRIALLESEVIGYGASGRNGGFNMTLFGLTLGITALRFGKENARQAHNTIRLDTTAATVSADKVVLATNAWSHFFPQLRRKQIPVWTHIVLTEPLTEMQFSEIGWKNRQGIEDARNLVHYYRLTADNRLLMGGRDVSLGTGMDMENDLNAEVFASLKEDIRELFPALDTIGFTHEWGGPVSVPLDMAPALGYAGDKQIVYSLGCVGHGVSMTHLNGRTIADLVLEKKTDLTDIFFVNRRTIPWPPGPLRAMTVKAILGYMHWEDRRFDQN